MYMRLRFLYVKTLLNLYILIKNILPKISYKLKKYIEKVSLKNSKLIYEEVIKL